MKVLTITVKAECLSECMSELVAKTSDVFLAIDQRYHKSPNKIKGEIKGDRKSISWRFSDEADK